MSPPPFSTTAGMSAAPKAAPIEAIRLGAEGNSGVLELLDAIRDAWMSRDPGNHTTPESEWAYKFEEAAESGLEKFGGITDQLKNLPEYNIGMVPSEIPDNLVTAENTGKAGFSRLLGALVKATDNDDRIASILWNCNATKETARDWGLIFVYRRIAEARITPEPIRENPKIEERREREKDEVDDLRLLTDEELEYCKKRPTFVDNYLAAGESTGFANPIYFRSSAWIVASIAFGFKGFLPITATDKMGLNLWNMTLGYSGTGKSRSLKFRDSCLDLLMTGDNPEGPHYNLGADSSPQGLHVALLQRDKLASFLGADEASNFFKKLAKSDWMTGLDDTLSDWYEGRISPANKLTQKDLAGKTALTSLTIQMFATPDRLTEVLTRDMFLTGFLARFNWSIGDPPIETDDRFNLLQQEEPEEFEGDPEVIQQVVADLVSARAFTGDKTVPLLATPEALTRMSEAYKRMYNLAKARENWDLTEPSVTRLMEAMRKCSGICAMYRSDSTINLDDALHAIRAVEEWFQNLFVVADMISAGSFQRDCQDIETWIIKQRGRVSRTRLLANFRNMIVKDPRELELRLTYLVDSGTINRVESDNHTVMYELNGA